MADDLGDSLPSRIATLVHSHFDALPARSKPIIRSDGTKEWIPMSGMVIVRGENTPSEQLTCVAVTSGAKCLSASQIPTCKGLVLHDCHAEILCLRAFNYWLLSECQSVLSAGQSPFLQRRQQPDQPPKTSTEPPLELHPNLKIYMYCTCAPCGDASMELTMASQDDATPWATEPSPSNTNNNNLNDDANPTPSSVNHDNGDTGDTLLDGRGYFSRLGIVRRKPARADAEATRSKSCSDKLALRQVSSLLSYESSLLVAVTRNAYLAGVVLPEEEISRVGCERAFGERGRMKGLVGRVWRGDGQGQGHDHASKGEVGADDTVYGYRYHPFQVLSIPTTLLQSLWQYRKPRSTGPDSASALESTKVKPGVVSAVWVAAASGSAVVSAGNNGAKSLPKLYGSKTGLYETILNGVKQGSKASQPTAKGASALSRARMWGLLRDILQVSGSSGGGIAGGAELDETLTRIAMAPTYQRFKKEPVLSTDPINARIHAIRDTKAELKGWVSNSGDESWGLDVLVDPPKRKRLLTDD